MPIDLNKLREPKSPKPPSSGGDGSILVVVIIILVIVYNFFLNTKKVEVPAPATASISSREIVASNNALSARTKQKNDSRFQVVASLDNYKTLKRSKCYDAEQLAIDEKNRVEGEVSGAAHPPVFWIENCCVYNLEDEHLSVIDDPDGYTNIRSGPSSKYTIIAKVVNGEQFYAIMDEKKIWWRVRKDNIQGYMHRSRIKIL